MISNDDLLAKLKEQAKFANLVKNGICECCGEINPYALGFLKIIIFQLLLFHPKPVYSALIVMLLIHNYRMGYHLNLGQNS